MPPSSLATAFAGGQRHLQQPAGSSNYEIQLLGQWRSDAYRLYLDIPHHRILSLSSCLHWAIPHGQLFKPPSLHLPSSLALSTTHWVCERAEATQYLKLLSAITNGKHRRTDTPSVRDLCKWSCDYTRLVDPPAKAAPQIASRDYMCLVDPPEKFINIFFINHSLAPNFFLSIK